MAVMPMQRIGIYALKSRRKPILELIQRRGVVEIHAEKAEDAVFRQTDTAPAKARFENNTSTLQAALEALDKLEPEKKSLFAPLEGRTPIPLSRYEETAGAAGKTLRAASRVNALWKKCADDRAEILRLEAQIRMLEPWSRLDVSMRTTGTASTAAFIGSFPAEYTEEALKAEIARGAPEIDGVAVEVLSAGTQQTCAFLLCHASNGAKLEAFLRSIGFTYPADRSKKPPQARMQDLNARIEKLRAEIDGAEAEIRTYAALRGAMQYTIDYFSMRIEKYDVLGRLWQSPHVFVITGYIPAESAPALEKELTEKFEAYVELETPAEDEDVPVKLKNNAFAAPVEGVLESYSMPGRKEIDPSTLMAVFYYFLFGMMLSDAGYGLLMVIGCGVALAKFKNMEESLRKFLKMFLYCGISTVFWGAMFGSFFGDAVTVIGKTFFNVDIAIPALWFTPLNEPMRLLLFSFLIGVIHLFAGLGAQFYQLARQGVVEGCDFRRRLLVHACRRWHPLSALDADVRRHGLARLHAARRGGHGRRDRSRHRRRRHRADGGPRIQKPVQSAFEGPVRPVRRVELSERHPLLFETARARPCDGRHRLGLQPDGRDARQQPGGRRRIRVRVPRRAHAEPRHQRARRLRAHQPPAVRGILRKILRGRQPQIQSVFCKDKIL